MVRTLGIVVAICCGALLIPLGVLIVIFGGGIGSGHSPQDHHVALAIGCTELAAAVLILVAGTWASLKHGRAGGVLMAGVALAGMGMLAYLGDPLTPFSWWLFGGALLGGVLVAWEARPEPNDPLDSQRTPRRDPLAIGIVTVVLTVIGLVFIWRFFLAGTFL